MRIKLDENLPQRLEPALVSLGHDVDTVAREGLPRFPPGSHAGILVSRLSDDRSQAVTERLRAVFASEPVEAWAACLVVVTDHKVRVRRPR